MALRETIALAASGDARARQTLVEGFYPTVERLVHKQLAQSFRQHHAWIGPLFSTGDVVHDVLVQVLDRLDAFAGDGDAEFAAYLATAVSHRLIDAVRHHQAGCRDVRRRAPTPVGEAAEDGATRNDPPEVAALAERMTIFRRVLDALPPADRALIELRLSDGLTFVEIAQRLGYASDNSARKAFDRAEARLTLRLRGAGLRVEGAP
ncbi:MAG: sigma-70 family RNA polymerase sigma factor [Planctomycetota bacterium]